MLARVTLPNSDWLILNDRPIHSYNDTQHMVQKSVVYCVMCLDICLIQYLCLQYQLGTVDKSSVCFSIMCVHVCSEDVAISAASVG